VTGASDEREPHHTTTGPARAIAGLPPELAGSLFTVAPFGIRVCSPDGRTRFANPAYGALVGLNSETLRTADFSSIVHPDDLAAEEHALLKARGGEHDAWRLEKRLHHAHGYWVWALTECRTIRSRDGRLVAIVEQAVDVSEQKMREEDLARNATHDALTGLPNRVLFTDRLRSALARSARRPSSVAVLFCDLDRFKHVNDLHGHAAGDELLMQVADRLRNVVRAGDTVARFGGDEFVILCEELTGFAEVEGVAKRIMHGLDTPFELHTGSVAIGASIGIAVAAADPADPEGLISDADVAVFHAKAEGRARVVTFTPDMHAETQGRLAAERELRDALDSGAIEPHFQPIVDVATGEVRGFEAFARWNHPTRGVLSPAEFLPIAEETGLIIDLGAHIFDAACAHVAAWRGLGPEGTTPYIAVTCSARQLVLPDLPDMISASIERYNIEPGLVCLEITESALTYDAETAVERLRRLRASGVRIAIDDFGVDHSSLAYLRRFPVDLVKIDTSFIAELGTDSGGSTIVAAVIALAHALGLGVVAEGVESIEQLAALYTLACDQAQGFLFSPAVPGSEAVNLLGRTLGIA